MNRRLIAGLWLAVAGAFAVSAYLIEWQTKLPPPAVPTEGITTESSHPFSFSLLPEPRPLPALQFTDGDGRAMTFANFKGRFILLNIWATWCVPCRKEMPTLDRLETKLGSSDFQVVALSIDQQGLPAVQSFYQEIKIAALRIYLDQSGKVASTLNVFGLPTTLLIDRQGRELGRLVGPAEWDSPEVKAFLEGVIGAATEPEHHADGTGMQPLPDLAELTAYHRTHRRVNAPSLRTRLTFQRWEGSSSTSIVN